MEDAEDIIICWAKGSVLSWPDSEEVDKPAYCLRGRIKAVSRALCLITGGLQPSGQSTSFKLNPFCYSGADPAEIIIKSVRERLIAMLPLVNNYGTSYLVVDLSHEELGALFLIFPIIWDILKKILKKCADFFRKSRKIRQVFEIFSVLFFLFVKKRILPKTWPFFWWKCAMLDLSMCSKVIM